MIERKMFVGTTDGAAYSCYDEAPEWMVVEKEIVILCAERGKVLKNKKTGEKVEVVKLETGKKTDWEEVEG